MAGNADQITLFGIAPAIPACCVLGSFVLYLLNRLNNRQPFSLFQVLNLDVSRETGRPVMILADMALSSALGGLVVMMIATPTTTVQAIVSGLGMTGLLSAHTRHEK